MKHFLAFLLLPLLFISCTENTSSIGIFPETDGITNSQAQFDVYTHSILLDSVVYKSTYNYLGSIKDPETNVLISANFAAQFHTFENFKFPSKNLLFPDPQNDHSQDLVECDSIELRLYYNGYYGDPNNPMKLEVYPLSFNNIIEEDSVFFTNTDLEQFVDAGTKPIATKVFTAEDYSVSENIRDDDSYTDNIRIMLPKEFGDNLLNTYYTNPEYYKNSYFFIRNVCPGFYFKIKSGTGTMVNVEVSTMNLFFTFYDKDDPTTVNEGICRFAATPEVIQSTQFTNGNLQELVDNNDCTYLKSPAGIATEVTLPINEIYANHMNDSISKAELTLTRYNSNLNDKYSLPVSQSVVMLRKDDLVSFFNNKKLPNDQTSFETVFSEAFNTYSFDNLGRLITYCRYEKLSGMKKSGLSEQEWENAHPNWNKLIVVPVSVKQSVDVYGYKTYLNVTHNMAMTSSKLVGGPNNPIKMQVIYSQFK